MDNKSEEPPQPTLWELLDAQINNRTCTQIATTVNARKYTFAFDMEGALVPILQVADA